ncbi:hypothetical protein ACEN9F_13565 [Duganella sp. CT11-25]|uniref:hypothetical protein n=1 Tax=unclassified Duganella TaxID=2636909 RepID=UPI0039B11344
MNTMNLSRSAPNALQILLEDDELASSCATVTEYRQALGLLLKNQFAGAPASAGLEHTQCRLTALITPGGRAYGLIPDGKGWVEDLINWSTREFRNPADARRIEACWNAFDGIRTEHIEARQGWKIVGEEGSTMSLPALPDLTIFNVAPLARKDLP